MSGTRVVYESAADGVARIRFESDTGVQLLSLEVLDQLAEVVRQVADQPPRVVVLEARGRTFLAGASLHELRALDQRSARRYSRRGQKLFRRIAHLPCLTVCAIHAACAGGGCELALACDFRYLAESARIGLPEVTLGLIPGWGGAARALRQLGPLAARRLILSGELIPAREAHQLGLADAVLGDDSFRSDLDTRLAQLLRAAPEAVATAKRFLAQGPHLDLDDLLHEEARLFSRCYQTREPAEGLAAFLEKRPARWPAPESAPDAGE